MAWSTSSGDLLVVGQPGRVLVDGARHAECFRLARHEFCEFFFVLGDILGDHNRYIVGRTCDHGLDRGLSVDGLLRFDA